MNKSIVVSDVWNEFLKEIKALCLERNFGTLSKSEFDLLVFHYYLLDKQSQAGEKYVTDYEIGRELGLTIQRVRALREKEALKWKKDLDWKSNFLGCIQFARSDSEGNVKIPIPDVNVIKEVRHYLEEFGLFDEFHLNPKVFQCHAEVLVLICLKMKDCIDDDFCKKILVALRKSKDENVVRVIDELESPISTAIKHGAIKDVKKLVCQIPGIENICEGLFDALAKKIAK